jgi:hypothetical protein
MKAKGMSISKRLSNLAAKEQIPFKHLGTAFLIERLVWRLTTEPSLASKLVFKGGFVGLRVYDSSRYTIDLDALLRKADIEATLKITQAAAEKDLDDGAWFRFERQIDLETQGEYGGIRQTYRAGFGEIPKQIGRAQTINFDLGIGDPVDPVVATTNSLLTGEELSWMVYPIETIIAEKLHALIERGPLNSRSKDIFDLSIFFPKANPKSLRQSIKKCFEYRNTELPKSLSENLKNIDTSLLSRGWASAVASVKRAPDFDATFSKLVSLLERFDQSGA